MDYIYIFYNWKENELLWLIEEYKSGWFVLMNFINDEIHKDNYC